MLTDRTSAGRKGSPQDCALPVGRCRLGVCDHHQQALGCCQGQQGCHCVPLRALPARLGDAGQQLPQLQPGCPHQHPAGTVHQGLLHSIRRADQQPRSQLWQAQWVFQRPAPLLQVPCKAPQVLTPLCCGAPWHLHTGDACLTGHTSFCNLPIASIQHVKDQPCMLYQCDSAADEHLINSL